MRHPARRRRPRRHRTALLGATALVAALVLGACSSGDGSAKEAASTTTAATGATNPASGRAPIDPATIEGGEAAYVQALVPLIVPTTGLSEAESTKAADCLAPKWVAIIGIDGFAAAGVRPTDLGKLGGGLEKLGVDEATATKMVAAFDDCKIDLRASALSQLTAGNLPDETKQCITDAITEDGVRRALVDNLVGAATGNTSFAEAEKCLDQTTATTTTTGG